MFRAFLLEQLNGTYAEFWVAMDAFRNAGGKGTIELAMLARELFEQFFSAESANPVPLKQRTKETLTLQLKNGETDTTIFDEAVSFFEHDVFRKFVRSDLYASFMADHGSFVRTASPKRRVSITELFKRKEERRASLGSFSAAVLEEDEDVHDHIGLNPHHIDLSKSIGASV